MIRLDNYLVEHLLVDSRTKAQTLIKDSKVSVNKKIIVKSSFKVDIDKDDIVLEKHDNYVSRASYKLKIFLEELRLDIKDFKALDIGSSTGGFTQILLENGVKEVYAVDVGKDQLHKSLRDDSRVKSFESCDIRKFECDEKFDIVVSDVSFISLHYILNDVDRLAKNKIILLFKPQFEVGREVKRDNRGVVIDDKAIEDAMKRFETVCEEKKWNLKLKSPSKLAGKNGNLEYCYYFEK